MRRLREDQQRMAMAQRGRGGMMQRGGPMRGGMIRGRGGVMLSRGGIKRPLQGHTGPRPSFQYRDGSFICDLCKKSFSDGNDMVSSSRLKPSQNKGQKKIQAAPFFESFFSAASGKKGFKKRCS